MEIRLYFQMLRRGWWIILLTSLTALSASLGASYLVSPQYQAVARLILSPRIIATSGPDLELRGISTIDITVMTTYSEVMNSNHIYNNALTFLQLQPEDMADYTYDAIVLPSSNVLELSVTGPDPLMAAEFANSIGYQTINFTRGLNQVFNLDFLDTAVPPVVPISPKPQRDAFLAVVFGMIGGVVIAILNEQIRFSLDSFRHRLRLDTVTGVYSSKYFPQLVEEELAQNADDVLTVGIIELSGIQDIYETLPSAGLQRILQRVTEILRREVRGNDVIGRWNDISFIVMLPNTTGVAATQIFKRIFESLSKPIDLGFFGSVVNLDSHIGGAEYGNFITTNELLDKANSTLEQARRSSDTPVYVWEMKNPFWT